MPSSMTLGQPITMLSSAARTTSSNSSNLKGTASNITQGSALSLYLDVTTLTGDGASATGLQVYIDTSPDGGTTWLNVAKFARVTSSTGTRVINCRRTGIGATEAAVFSTTSGVSVATNSVWAADNRVRWELGNNTGATVVSGSTFAVYAIVQPIGSTP